MGKYKSSSNWEESYFGGFLRILLDYPELRIPWDIDTETPKENSFSLSSFTRDKLLGLFQMKINEFKLSEKFFEGAQIITKKNWLGKEKYYLVPSAMSINIALNNVIAMDAELASLFDHYKKLIATSSFYYPYTPPESDKSKKPGEQEDEGEENKEGDEETSEENKDGESKEKKKRGEGEKEEDEKDGKGKSKDKEEKKGGGEKENKKQKQKPDISGTKAIATAKKQAKDFIDEIMQKKKFWIIQSALSGKHKENTVFRLMSTKGVSSIKYTSDEERKASQLLSMLDISFDPERDKIPNLRNGKLDVAKLGSVPAGNHHVYYTVEENQTTKPFSVCILGDESGSMSHYGYHRSQHSMIKILYRAFSQILPANKIYVYGHSGQISPEIRIYNDNYNQIFEDCIAGQLTNQYMENYDGPVIENIYERIRQSTSDNIIFIAISDGLPQGHHYGGVEAVKDLKRVIEKCKRDGFVTAGIGINLGQIKEIYNYHTLVTDLSQMPKQVSLLINQVVKTEFQV